MLDHYSPSELGFNWNKVCPGDVVWFKRKKIFIDYSRSKIDYSAEYYEKVRSITVGTYDPEKNPNGTPMYVIGKQAYETTHGMMAYYMQVIIAFETMCLDATIRVAAFVE